MDARWSAEDQIPDKEVLELLERQIEGKFAPSTSWAYSNSGHVMLGLIVEWVSDEPFDESRRIPFSGKQQMNASVVYVKGKNQIPTELMAIAARNIES